MLSAVLCSWRCASANDRLYTETGDPGAGQHVGAGPSWPGLVEGLLVELGRFVLLSAAWLGSEIFT